MSPHEAVKATATQRSSCADQLAKLKKACPELNMSNPRYLHGPDRRESGAQPLKGAMPRKELPS